MCLRAPWGQLGFVGHGGTHEVVRLASLGSVESRSEAMFEKHWLGSLVLMWFLLFAAMDME